MNNLINIKIQENADGKKAVSAREMYLNLGLKEGNWQRWANKNIEKNPFANEGKDWISLTLMVSKEVGHSSSGRVKKGNYAKDYVLTLDFAKKLCMQARTERGEKVRDYFLEVERVAIAATNISPELEARLRKLEALTAHQEVTEFTVFAYASLCKIKLCREEAIALGKAAAKICRADNLPIGKVRDYRYGLINTYPENVLHTVFSEFVKKPRF